MKKALLFVVALLVFSVSFAQDYSIEEIKIIQNLFGAQKKVVFENNMDLSKVDANSFWQLYNTYEIERKKIGESKMLLLESYVKKEGAVTSEEANEVLKQASNIRSSENSLILKYVKRIKKATNPIVAAQFYQIEHYISDGVRFALLDNLDFIHRKE